jgi:antitoxin (DNA-binding transcriptional repressor) of toxin-antitoxin stability system
VVVAAAAAGLMVVLVEDSRASASLGPGSRPPRPRQLSSAASRGGPNQGADPKRKTRQRGAVGAASLPLTSRNHPGQRNCSQPLALVRGAEGCGGALEPTSAGREPPAGTPGI